MPAKRLGRLAARDRRGLSRSLFAVLPVAIGTAAMGLLGDVTTIALTIAATGAGCALISRHFIRWAEPLPQA